MDLRCYTDDPPGAQYGLAEVAWQCVILSAAKDDKPVVYLCPVWTRCPRRGRRPGGDELAGTPSQDVYHQMSGAPTPGDSAGGRLSFLRQFLRNPRELGSITPSSRFLTRAIVEEIDFPRARRIVELGPGTGVFTREVLRHLDPGGALVALDTSADFVALLRRELPDPRLVAVQASAEQIGSQVTDRGWDAADVVISGIPYTLLPRSVTDGIVRASWRALAPGGLFLAYQYSPYLRPFLKHVFGNCRLKVILRNIPPAVVFVSHKTSGE